MKKIQVLEKNENIGKIYHKLKYQWIEDNKTQVKVSLFYKNTTLYINFDVFENEIRRKTTHNNDKVYQDSCVECFFQIPESREYYNFEFSASSFVLVGRGENRDNRISFNDETLNQIKRKVTILDEGEELSHWMIDIEIDLIKWGLIKDLDLQKQELKANFYKCGDKLKSPHYFSLFDINSENPDFHKPDSFGILSFV
jgi:hypothetical protein